MSILRKTAACALLLTCLAGAAAAQQAMLWLPADGRPDDAILSLLEADPALRLTAAFSELPKANADRVRRLAQEGRLELALRPAGDPPLPLLYAPAEEGVKWAGKPSTSALSGDQYFMGLRISLAREAALKDLKQTPPGFAVPPGGLAADYFPLAKAMGIKWLACGPLASTASAVMEAEGVYAVPFVLFSTAARAGPLPLFTVFDETSAPDPAALRALLAAELAAPAPHKRLTVSEALGLASSSAAAAAEIAALSAPWSGDYTPWAGAPAQAGALAALAKTRAELMLHLNAQQGNYKAAAPAFTEYFSAEEGPGLLALGRAGSEEAAEREAETQTALANAYRLMQRTPPPWVFSGLADAAENSGQPDQLRIESTAAGFEITNISRKPEAPAGYQAPPGTDPYKLWKLASFKVTSNSDEIVFSFRPGQLDNSARGVSGFSHIRLDLYIDINHRPRAGITRPLEGRPLRLFPDNAWEYALEITPAKATLYAVTPKGPALAGSFQPKAEGGAVSVRVPRSVLKGNPRLWGYAALLLAPGEAKKFTITDYVAASISNGYIYAVRPGGK
ncbi:MAG: hypothetical protein NDI60_11295 [Elusimicrobiales bacterium]|nr:hypothetical protein [Elusimicrobiales bacterium]